MLKFDGQREPFFERFKTARSKIRHGDDVFNHFNSSRPGHFFISENKAPRQCVVNVTKLRCREQRRQKLRTRTFMCECRRGTNLRGLPAIQTTF